MVPIDALDHGAFLFLLFLISTKIVGFSFMTKIPKCDNFYSQFPHRSRANMCDYVTFVLFVASIIWLIARRSYQRPAFRSIGIQVSAVNHGLFPNSLHCLCHLPLIQLVVVKFFSSLLSLVFPCFLFCSIPEPFTDPSSRCAGSEVVGHSLPYSGYSGWDNEAFEEAKREQLFEAFEDEDLLYALHDTFADEEADLYGPLALL
jgi:hypothetical protein